jgi:hypothetical protein
MFVLFTKIGKSIMSKSKNRSNTFSSTMKPLPSPRKSDSNAGEWRMLGWVTIDAGTLLLIDPVRGTADVGELGAHRSAAQVPIAGDDFSALLLSTGMADGRYMVEGRFANSLFGWRITEIRVRFPDDKGNYLGGDKEESYAGRSFPPKTT